MSEPLAHEHANPSEPSPGRAAPPVEDARDEKVAHLETIVSYVLRFGVFLSLSITFVGLVLLFVTDPIEAVVRRTGPPVPHHAAAVLADLLQLRPKAIIDAGLILLIMTPIARVAVTVVAFALEGDAVYTAITLFVLMILLASFILGRAG